MPGLTVLLVALVGIAINTGSALLFKKSQKHDLNAKGAFLHMAADAAVSGAVVLAAAAIILTGWQWLDPAVAIAVSALIAITAWSLMRDALRLGLDAVPEHIDRQKVADWIGNQPGVSNVHDLHIWALSTTRTALAAHVVWAGVDGDHFIEGVTDGLEHEFGIGHVTLHWIAPHVSGPGPAWQRDQMGSTLRKIRLGSSKVILIPTKGVRKQPCCPANPPSSLTTGSPERQSVGPVPGRQGQVNAFLLRAVRDPLELLDRRNRSDRRSPCLQLARRVLDEVSTRSVIASEIGTIVQVARRYCS